MVKGITWDHASRLACSEDDKTTWGMPCGWREPEYDDSWGLCTEHLESCKKCQVALTELLLEDL